MHIDPFPEHVHLLTMDTLSNSKKMLQTFIRLESMTGEKQCPATRNAGPIILNLKSYFFTDFTFSNLKESRLCFTPLITNITSTVELLPKQIKSYSIDLHPIFAETANNFASGWVSIAFVSAAGLFISGLLAIVTCYYCLKNDPYFLLPDAIASRL